MLISMNWISDFVDFTGLDKESLIKRFTLSTAEVEEIIHKGNDLEGVVAAKIISVKDIQNSRKLHMLKVDAGEKIYDVVCGAPNVREGMIVPLAKEGGRVGEMKIGCAILAGCESHGMCCSEAELGISADHSGLMELDPETVLGTDVKDLFEIEDIVFEVDNKSLTNRPDLWGHYGIAREFAALTGRALKPIDRLDLSQYSSLSPVDIKILDSEHCYRYAGLKVSNIKKKVSPVNMRIRLFYCGSRGINLLADLTNYIMMELGQPMHAFDRSKVSEIEVKRYEKLFNFTTLDGEERKIDENTVMITCKDKPIAIGGIMGGLESEIEDDTDTLLLESANFDAVSIRKSSTRIGLRTDASMRYEKTLDPETVPVAIERFMYLLNEIDPGTNVDSSLTDVNVKSYPEISISFDKPYVDRYTGIDISNEQIMETLKSLGFGVSLENGLFTVDVPSWRRTKDVTMKADIVEEITRIYGYDNFEIKTTTSPLYPVKRTPQSKADNYTKDLLVQKYGLHEVHSYIWCDNKRYKELGIEIEKNVRIINAMTTDNDVLRNCMIPSLLSIVSENKSYSPDYGIFEIGRIVSGLDSDQNCIERKKLGIVLYSRSESEKELFYKISGIVRLLGRQIKKVDLELSSSEAVHNWQHPKNTAIIKLGEKELGFISALHPTVSGRIDKKASLVCAEIDMMDFASIPSSDVAYVEPSKYPGIDFDLSLAVSEEISYSDIKSVWEKLNPEYLTGSTVIDVFSDGSQSSVTVRLSFSSNEKTLTREEIQPIVDEIISALSQKGINLKS